MGNKRQHSGRGRHAGRALLLFLLLACIAGAGYLGYLAFTELKETKQGDDFYAQLAASVETVSPAPVNTAEANNSQDPEPTVLPESAAADGATPAPDTGSVQSTYPPLVSAAGTDGIPAEPSPAVDATAPAVWQPAVTLLPETPAPTPTPRPSEMDFESLWQTCPDVVGWIRLADSVIDYPVVLGEDNDFYLHHLADKTENKAGSIMMDESNHGDFSDEITILHGHHMRSGSMFGRLADFKEEEYYLEHKIIRLYTPAGDYDVAVFAAYTVNGYTFGYPTSFQDETAFETFLRRALSATPYETDVSVEYGDRILMLSTCAYSYDGARFVVLGKIMEPEETTGGKENGTGT